ncbi:MAG: alpha/beta hydrolase [Rhodospirillales bacterium]|nr:alpha/beta hydrolase [Rhodospirillales bacterium]
MNEAWRELDQDALDRGLNNTAGVADSAAILAGWDRRSAAFRESCDDRREIVYGPKPRNRIDLFGARPGAPLFVFVHGGYWQSRSRENFHFLAEGPMSRGLDVAMVGYTLAPDATLDAIIGEVRSALDELDRETAAPLLLGGWSAGAHLAVMAGDRPSVRGTLAISGIYDLEPVRHSYLNQKLQLDEAASLRNSPMRRLLRPSAKLALAVGGAELPLVRGQTLDYAAALGVPVQAIAGANHFTILDQLASPDGVLTETLAKLASFLR